MVDSAAVALRLLELIALLFPVVALLLQLQYRENTNDMAAIGGVIGTGLVLLLSLSFSFVTLYLVTAHELSALLTVSIVVITIMALLVPLLVVLSLGRPIDVEGVFAPDYTTMIRTARSCVSRNWRDIYRRWK